MSLTSERKLNIVSWESLRSDQIITGDSKFITTDLLVLADNQLNGSLKNKTA